MANYSDAQLAAELRELLKDVTTSHKRRRQQGTIVPAESAATLDRLWATISRLEQLANLSPLQLQFLDLVLCIDAATPAPVKKPKTQLMNITGAQCEKITRLLNHPFMPRPEKTQGMLRINHLNQEQADAFILELEQRGEELDHEPQVGGPEEVSVNVQLVGQHPAVTPTSRDEAYTELTELLRSEHVREQERINAGKVIGQMSEAQLREKLAVVKATIAERKVKSLAKAA